jgi:CBS domain containing-hemolysin-like protein
MAYAALSTFRFPATTRIAQAQPKAARPVDLSSPALEVMTDLTQVKAATIDPSTSLHSAEQMMIQQGVRLLFVVTEFPSIEGLVTSTDLLGEKPLRLISQRNVRHEELCVADVMTELSLLDALDYEELKSATVGALVETFIKVGRNHMLVVQAESAQGAARIRGVLSRSQLERQLGVAIAAVEVANTFAEIEKALA